VSRQLNTNLSHNSTILQDLTTLPICTHIKDTLKFASFNIPRSYRSADLHDLVCTHGPNCYYPEVGTGQPSLGFRMMFLCMIILLVDPNTASTRSPNMNTITPRKVP
jgi:hypothetical protein